MTTTISIYHALDADAVKRENTQDEIADFIMELDSAVAESDFTEKLILDLAKSLSGDAKTSDMARIADRIASMEGYAP